MPTVKPKFAFELADAGMANAVLVCKNITVQFAPTNVCDPVGDLLRALEQLLTNPTYLWGDPAQSSLVWYDDNSSLTWLLTMTNDKTINLNLKKSEGFFQENSETLLDVDCSSYDFINSVVSEFDKMIKHSGLLNYQQHWQNNEFPLTTFLFLKKALIDKKKWKSSASKDHILNDELNLLLN